MLNSDLLVWVSGVVEPPLAKAALLLAVRIELMISQNSQRPKGQETTGHTHSPTDLLVHTTCVHVHFVHGHVRAYPYCTGMKLCSEIHDIMYMHVHVFNPPSQFSRLGIQVS